MLADNLLTKFKATAEYAAIASELVFEGPSDGTMHTHLTARDDKSGGFLRTRRHYFWVRTILVLSAQIAG